MKAMLMAAGRGQRMWPLTKDTPKPLLKVGEDSLIERHIKRLAKVGIVDIVVNLSYLGEKIRQTLGNGSAYGVMIHYSVEPDCLEVGGGIVNALPLLGNDPFLVINGDVWTDYPFEQLLKPTLGAMHLVLVPNPPHNNEGDVSLNSENWVGLDAPRYTFSGLGRYHPDCFSSYPCQKLAFREILNTMIPRALVSGEYYTGDWFDVGTPERLDWLRAHCQSACK